MLGILGLAAHLGKYVKYLGLHVRGYSNAIVGDLDFDISAVDSGCETNLAPLRGIFCRIVEKIADNLG